MKAPSRSSTISAHTPSHTHKNSLIALTIGALGVVFGDIGTSPLYAMNEIFFGHALKTHTTSDVFGAVSLVFWAITLVITFKYVFFVMRADNEGEGGVFALYSQIASLQRPPLWLLGLLLFGSGLLYGDGMITPAISVISAVEGMRILAPSLDRFVIPITIAILTLLFFIQKNGTHKVGLFFGPIMVTWFITIGTLGFMAITRTPQILSALLPMHAWSFVLRHNPHTLLLTLGSVMLVITGGEAMFADMGHFGRLPIRIGWYILAYPALILNYLGQGAYLLSGNHVTLGNIFFSMVPHTILPIVVVLATCATVIASQAMISGAFSLTKQAVSLRLLPYLPTVYTHKDHEGQIYIPFINWALWLGAVTLVIVFGSSTRLAGAYGLAVAGDMFITTISMIVISMMVWRWSPLVSLLLFIPMLFLDAGFLTANSLKIFVGGYLPLSIGVIIFGIITIWTWGRKHVIEAFRTFTTMTVGELVDLQQDTVHDLERTMIYLTRDPILSHDDHVPIQMQKFWQRNGILPRHLAFLNVELLKVPHAKERFVIKHLNTKGIGNGSITSITVYFGFMEDPDIEPLIRTFIKHHDVPSNHPPENWSFKVIHERPMLREGAGLIETIKFTIYSMIAQNTTTSDVYFGLGQNHQLTIDILPVRMR